MPELSRFTAELPLPEDTDRLGSALAGALLASQEAVRTSGAALRLEGDLGAGKTSLIRAMLRALGWKGAVKSPTFTLLESYEASGLTVHHFDFYRFETPEEFEDAGFQDLYAAGAVCASEWSIKAEPCLPPADLTVSLSPEGFGRRAVISAETELGQTILASWEARWTAAA